LGFGVGVAGATVGVGDGGAGVTVGVVTLGDGIRATVVGLGVASDPNACSGAGGSAAGAGEVDVAVGGIVGLASTWSGGATARRGCVAAIAKAAPSTIKPSMIRIVLRLT